MSDPTKPPVLVGLVRLRDHCTFTWAESERGGRRVATVYGTHCAQCVAELQERGYGVAPEGDDDKTSP